ncbi:hypothetical protein [Streptomyces sp. B15]|uniref:DUF7352 domain-containing protein n=1 Tax=Streptomyces sp. B15 TaxID=1537797 RepID=UPI001B37BD24|nr:hypothetical protein [Streptomyces sp. B15]MBQ1122629.1 hypothetical protein [Streptomyces sp. B15]
MPTRRMLRHGLVVSDTPTQITLDGDPVHVAAARLGAGPNAQHIVEFWAEGSIEDTGTERTRTFQVIGTGHALPDGARHWGTTDRTPEGLVWHLYELPESTAR